MRDSLASGRDSPAELRIPMRGYERVGGHQ